MPTEAPLKPTPSQLYADLPFVDQCVPVAIDALLNIFRDPTSGINVQLDYVGSHMTPVLTIPHYREILVAPETLTDAYLNCLIIAWSLDASPQGTQAYLNSLHVTLTDVQRRAEVKQQVDAKWYRAGVVRTLCNWFRQGYLDSNARQCWVQLDILGAEQLPDKDFYGVSMHLLLTQGPGVNNWI